VADAVLQQRLDDVKALLKIWNHFYKILALVFQTEDEIPDEKEREFQQIKTLVAEKHDSFMRVIEKDEHVGQNILTMVKRVISLSEFRRLSRLEVNKLLIEWHDANILLNETLGSLEYRLSDSGMRSQREQEKAATPTFDEKLKAFLTGPRFKQLMALFVILVAAGVIYIFRDQIRAHWIYGKYIGPVIESVKDLIKVGD
jgi:hypothetical protein